MLNGVEPGQEKDALQTRLNDSEKRWTDVKNGTEQRSKDIADLKPKSEDFDDNSVTFSCWLMKAETRRQDFTSDKLLADRDRVDQRRNEIEVRNS